MQVETADYDENKFKQNSYESIPSFRITKDIQSQQRWVPTLIAEVDFSQMIL